VDKIAKKAVCGSAFLTIWHCIWQYGTVFWVPN